MKLLKKSGIGMETQTRQNSFIGMLMTRQQENIGKNILPAIKATLQFAAKNVTSDDIKKLNELAKPRKVEPTYAAYKKEMNDLKNYARENPNKKLL